MATAAEVAELLATIDGLVEPLKRSNRVDPPNDARRVSLQIRAVPID